MLARRAPFTRKTPLARGTGPLTTKTGLHRGDKPLAAMSARRRRKLSDETGTRQQVRDRDQACLLRRHAHIAGACFGPPEIHHLRKASQQGKVTLANAVLLCSGHNQWVENQPATARRLGLVVSWGETTTDAWARMTATGLPVTGNEVTL